MKRILTVLAVALAGAASAGDSRQPPTILGHLETQDRVVTICAGPQPRYTVRMKDGKVLAERITAAELRERYPDFYRFNDATAVAGVGL